MPDWDLTDHDCDLTDLYCVVKTNVDPCRKVSNVTIGMTDSVVETTLELDSHASTCVLGRHALITLDYNRPVSVTGYDASLGTHTYKIISGVIGYTDPTTGRTLHLVINHTHTPP